MDSERSFECGLQQLPSEFVTDKRANKSRGRDALQRGDGVTAAYFFLQCKEMLCRDEVKEHLGEVAFFTSLLAVANLLVQVYQSMRSVETLKKAVTVREEMLSIVMTLPGLGAEYPAAVKVCKSYCYTAQYELGSLASVSSETIKYEATRKYAALLSCTEGEAEAQLCYLVCVDYECLGKFAVSVGWIQKAIRVMKEKKSSGWNDCKLYFLGY